MCLLKLCPGVDNDVVLEDVRNTQKGRKNESKN